METVVSAPGKVILHGEHAVVYGKTALAASLNIRTTLKLTTLTRDVLNLNLPNIGVFKSWDLFDIKKHLKNKSKISIDGTVSLSKIFNFCGIQNDSNDTKELAVVAFIYLLTSILDDLQTGLDISVDSALPPGAGLGSSAAYSTCLAASLLLYSGKIVSPYSEKVGEKVEVVCGATIDSGLAWHNKLELDLINKYSFMSEKVIHGKPSGVDNSISTFGGVIEFKNGNINHLEGTPPLRILLTNTKVPRSTKVLVSAVKDRLEKHPRIIEPILSSINCISENCRDLLLSLEGTSTDLKLEKEFSEMIEMNQGLLNSIGVSHPSLDQIVLLTSQHGLRSKLTGAGGGGCAFTYFPTDTTRDQKDNIESGLEGLGFECWDTTIGGPGVMLHQHIEPS